MKNPNKRAPPAQSKASHDIWRDALIELLDLKNLFTEEIDDICIDRSPGGDPTKGEHPKGEWVAWDAEYPEEGSVSLTQLVSPPHIAAVAAGDAVDEAVAERDTEWREALLLWSGGSPLNTGDEFGAKLRALIATDAAEPPNE